MNAILELANRVEAATGQDRDLDWTVHCRDGLWGVGMYGSHPAYTASLDAAMSLKPEGWLLQLSEWEHEELRARGPWQAILVRSRDCLADAFLARCNHAAEPALALTAASLRAIAVQGDPQ